MVDAARPLQVASLPPALLADAARLLAAGMRDNPLHLRVFGATQARLEPLLADAFVRLLDRQRRTGHVLGAFDGERLVGVAAMVAPGHCQPPAREKATMLRILARARSLHRLPRIACWLHAWRRHDPRFDHWHLGPAAVARGRRGQGIGTRLMEAVCERLDRCGGVGYLETDKPENVRLYRRGGFEEAGRQRVLGVDTWFMLRHPRCPGPPHCAWIRRGAGGETGRFGGGEQGVPMSWVVILAVVAALASGGWLLARMRRGR